jgi:hypothetical protein
MPIEEMVVNSLMDRWEGNIRTVVEQRMMQEMDNRVGAQHQRWKGELDAVAEKWVTETSEAREALRGLERAVAEVRATAEETTRSARLDTAQVQQQVAAVDERLASLKKYLKSVKSEMHTAHNPEMEVKMTGRMASLEAKMELSVGELHMLLEGATGEAQAANLLAVEARQTAATALRQSEESVASAHQAATTSETSATQAREAAMEALQAARRALDTAEAAKQGALVAQRATTEAGENAMRALCTAEESKQAATDAQHAATEVGQMVMEAHKTVREVGQTAAEALRMAAQAPEMEVKIKSLENKIELSVEELHFLIEGASGEAHAANLLAIEAQRTGEQGQQTASDAQQTALEAAHSATHAHHTAMEARDTHTQAAKAIDDLHTMLRYAVEAPWRNFTPELGTCTLTAGDEGAGVSYRSESDARAALATELPQYLRAEIADVRRALEADNNSRSDAETSSPPPPASSAAEQDDLRRSVQALEAALGEQRVATETLRCEAEAARADMADAHAELQRGRIVLDTKFQGVLHQLALQTKHKGGAEVAVGAHVETAMAEQREQWLRVEDWRRTAEETNRELTRRTVVAETAAAEATATVLLLDHKLASASAALEALSQSAFGCGTTAVLSSTAPPTRDGDGDGGDGGQGDGGDGACVPLVRQIGQLASHVTSLRTAVSSMQLEHTELACEVRQAVASGAVAAVTADGLVDVQHACQENSQSLAKLTGALTTLMNDRPSPLHGMVERAMGDTQHAWRRQAPAEANNVRASSSDIARPSLRSPLVCASRSPPPPPPRQQQRQQQHHQQQHQHQQPSPRTPNPVGSPRDAARSGGSGGASPSSLLAHTATAPRASSVLSAASGHSSRSPSASAAEDARARAVVRRALQTPDVVASDRSVSPRKAAGDGSGGRRRPAEDLSPQGLVRRIVQLRRTPPDYADSRMTFTYHDSSSSDDS